MAASSHRQSYFCCAQMAAAEEKSAASLLGATASLMRSGAATRASGTAEAEDVDLPAAEYAKNFIIGWSHHAGLCLRLRFPASVGFHPFKEGRQRLTGNASLFWPICLDWTVRAFWCSRLVCWRGDVPCKVNARLCVQPSCTKHSRSSMFRQPTWIRFFLVEAAVARF